MKVKLTALVLVALLAIARQGFAADSAVVDMTATTTPATTDILYLVADPAGTPLDRKVAVSNLVKVSLLQGLGTGVGTFLGTPSSANLLSALTTKTGTGLSVFDTSPTLVTPILGVAAATSINKLTLTTPATGSTFTLIDGKTFTVSNTLTLSGTDSSTLNIGTGGTLGTAAYTAATAYAVPGANTFTALQTITQASANAGILASTGYSLTGSDATNMVDLAGTWNTSGAPTIIKANITNTASGATSKFLDFQIGGVSKLRFYKSGGIIIQGATSNDLLTLGTGSSGNGAASPELSYTSNALGQHFVLIGDTTGSGGPAQLKTGSGFILTWQSTTRSDSGATDTILFRKSAGIVGAGTTAAGTTDGTFQGLYKSSDGTSGATTTCTIVGLTSITVKNGLITGCS